MKPKPYDTTPPPNSTAEEPALAYATTPPMASSASAIGRMVSVAEVLEAIETTTPELMQLLNERLEDMESNPEDVYTQEDMDRMHQKWKKERTAHKQQKVAYV